MGWGNQGRLLGVGTSPGSGRTVKLISGELGRMLQAQGMNGLSKGTEVGDSPGPMWVEEGAGEQSGRKGSLAGQPGQMKPGPGPG